MRALLIVTCLAAFGFQESNIVFENVTAKAGIRFQNVFGSMEKTAITDVNGSGAAFLDYDKDGQIDLYLVNGARKGTDAPGNALYRNTGNGVFVDVSEEAGVKERRWGLGVAAADFDNDGSTDLYVTNYGRNTLYRNTGRGAFVDATEQAGVGKTGYSSGAAFGDYDNDGWLDLFVANYIDFDPSSPSAKGKGCSYKGVPVFCGPGGFTGGRNVLYHNNRDGTFRDVTDAAGVTASEPHYSFTAVFEDFNGDGWPDLFVANDSTANYLYKNLGDGRFKEIGLEAGVALSEDGRAQASMGVAVGDYNNDGRPDLFVTNFSDDVSNLFRNDGNMMFTEQIHATGLSGPSLQMLKWGALLEDFDNDGRKDVFVANGHIYPDVDAHRVNTTYRQWLQVFRNTGGRFVESGQASGIHGVGRLAARTAIAGDIHNDGGVDVLVSQIDGPPVLFANQSRRGNWVIFDLEGRRSNRSAVGARIRVRAGGLDQWSSVRSGGSYISQNDLRVHFGLGSATTIEAVDIVWPSGSETHERNRPANQVFRLAEPALGSLRNHCANRPRECKLFDILHADFYMIGNYSGRLGNP
jgi:enediyne biosynthesis protein E4